MSRRARKWVYLVGGTVAVCAVAGFYFAKSGRLGPRSRAHLLRIKINGEALPDVAMLVDQAECQKLLKERSQDWDELRGKYRMPVDLACVPEDDPSVPAKWKAPTRIVGKWRGCDVYYYHEPEPQTLAGAFVLALPKENDKPGHFPGEPEIDEIFVDQRTCETDLVAYKDYWESQLDFRRAYEHDPKLRAKNPSYEQRFKEDERLASGACIPIANAMPLVNRLCEGLPLMLTVRDGRGIYSCDSTIVRPAGAAPS